MQKMSLKKKNLQLKLAPLNFLHIHHSYGSHEPNNSKHIQKKKQQKMHRK